LSPLEGPSVIAAAAVEILFLFLLFTSFVSSFQLYKMLFNTFLFDNKKINLDTVCNLQEGQS